MLITTVNTIIIILNYKRALFWPQLIKQEKKKIVHACNLDKPHL